MTVPGLDTVKTLYMVESTPLASVILTLISNHRVKAILIMKTKFNSLLLSQWGSKIHSCEILCGPIHGKKATGVLISSSHFQF